MDYSLGDWPIRSFLRLFIDPSTDNNFASKFIKSRLLLFCAVFLLILKLAAVSVSIEFPQNIFFADIAKSSLEALVNQTRQSFGLQPLNENLKLDQAAQLKAENMVQNQYFNHTSPTGISPWYWFLQAGYKYQYAGENLAIGFYESGEVYNAWLNSADHKANIINPNYTEFGTAVLSGFGQNNATIVVQEFGSQSVPKNPAPANNNKNASVTPVAKVETNKPQQVSVASNQSSPSQTSLPVQTNEQVLAQSTGPQISKISNGEDSIYLRLLSFVTYGYYGILQNIIYGATMIMAGGLVLLILFYRKKELVFRATMVLTILAVASLIGEGTIVSLIPHNLII
jgi:hypothetical protein